MFGFNHNDPVEDMECEFGYDPVDQEMTDLTQVSIQRPRRAPQCDDLYKGFRRNRKVRLIRRSRPIRKRPADAQDETDMEWESSSPEEDKGREEARKLSMLPEQAKRAKMERQPDQTKLPEQSEQAKMEKQPEQTAGPAQTEQAEMAQMERQPMRAKPRRGGVIHRHENHCCPFLPSRRPLLQSHYELLLEDFRDLGQIFFPRLFWL